MEKEYSANLSDNEKVIIMRSIFQSERNPSHKYIKNASDFISGNFEKIKGFDFRWTSLISNNPLLFEDIDYLRVKSFIDNKITDEERQAYVDGDLSDIYATFDNMLMCNLRYYDRIISYCTLVFLHYVRVNDEPTNKYLEKVPYELSLTPTRIYCAALAGINSTEWELKYGWGKIRQTQLTQIANDKSIFEKSYASLYKNITFAKFIEYAALRNDTVGFRETFISDVTTNRKLSQVCAKFTKASVAISEQQLETIYEYSKECDNIKDRLYVILDKCLENLFNGDTSQYAIYIFNKEFYIHTSKFSMRVTSINGAITKDYLANSYECFAAEEFLVPSIKMQIEWAKYTTPNHFEYDKNILKSLLQNMLETDFRTIVCFKRMNDYGIVSKVTFKGSWAMVKMVEEFITDKRTIKSVSKILNKANAAKFLVDRGYYIFGIEKDVFEVADKFNKQSVINHYSNYCVPILQHMYDVITTHQLSKNDIIDVVVSGKLNPSKLNNDNIKYVSVYDNASSKQLFAPGLAKQNLTNTLDVRKSYWTAIE